MGEDCKVCVSPQSHHEYAGLIKAASLQILQICLSSHDPIM
jgi:hypothetical protein